MQYLCLVYGEETAVTGLSPNEGRALTRDSLAYDRELEKKGHLVVAQALKSVRTAKTVRVRRNKVLTTDGPFAETKEQLLGFILIEAADEQEAVSIASGIPLAKLGSIEVRAVMSIDEE